MTGRPNYSRVRKSQRVRSYSRLLDSGHSERVQPAAAAAACVRSILFILLLGWSTSSGSFVGPLINPTKCSFFCARYDCSHQMPASRAIAPMLSHGLETYYILAASDVVLVSAGVDLEVFSGPWSQEPRPYNVILTTPMSLAVVI